MDRQIIDKRRSEKLLKAFVSNQLIKSIRLKSANKKYRIFGQFAPKHWILYNIRKMDSRKKSKTIY